MVEVAATTATDERQQGTAPQPILGAHYSMPGLSDVERILVVSDGTFTYQLETFVREPIGVEILSNQLAPLSSSDELQQGQFGLGSSNTIARQGQRSRLLLCKIADQ